ncbi:hypothetical protein HGRIS_007102 [Hohenbuehelia grisea]|uniref:Extracellular serine-rich protein n=1 Tax=Hohenbuehelia grisea TaxID=104357 RepID=A0ABR3JBS3_9AGAR
MAKAPCKSLPSRVCARLFGWIALIIPFAIGQKVIDVEIGQAGSFFVPENITASEDDVVRFHFLAGWHDVTQGSFESPCQPLQGGFGTGVIKRESYPAGQPPTWDLRIVDATKPIWFYCATHMPSPHCTTGMVGVINGPSDQYEDYRKASLLVNPSSVPTASVALAGIGATATATPRIPGADTSTASTPLPKGAIVGIAACVVIVLAILGTSIYYICRSRHMVLRPSDTTVVEAAPITPFYSVYGNRSAGYPDWHQRSMSEPILKHIPSEFGQGPDMAASSPPYSSYHPPYGRKVPGLYGNPAQYEYPDNRFLPTRSESPVQLGFPRRTASHTRLPSEHDSGVNLGVLAREVAEILSSPSRASPVPGGSQLRAHSQWQGGHQDAEQPNYEHDPLPPPRYQLQ